MNKKIILKILITIFIILHIIYIIIFGKYIFIETLSFRENGKTYYVRQSLHKYQVIEMSNDFIPKELSYELQKIGGDYIDNIKKAGTKNISIGYRVFSGFQLVAIIGLIVYYKKINKDVTKQEE